MKRIEQLNSIQKTNHETIDKPKNMKKQMTISNLMQKTHSLTIGLTRHSDVMAPSESKNIEDMPDDEFAHLKPIASFKFPSHLSKKDDLVQMLTKVIFTGSVVHRAINGPSFEYNHFIPIFHFTSYIHFTPTTDFNPTIHFIPITHFSPNNSFQFPTHLHHKI